MFKKTFALIVTGLGSLAAQEPLASELPSLEHSKESSVKVMGYGSCSAFFIIPVPGVGVSVRSGNWATDASLNGVVLVNSATLTASQIWYSDARPRETRSYVSLGLGPTMLFTPLNVKGDFPRAAYGASVPLRWGKEWENSFVDVGVSFKAVVVPEHARYWQPYILPEVRGGLRF